MALASIHQNEMTTSQPVNQVQASVSNQGFTVGQSWGALRKLGKDIELQRYKTTIPK